MVISYKCTIGQASFLNVIPTGTTNETSWLFRTWYEDHIVNLTYTSNEVNSIFIGDTIFSIGFFITDRANRDFEFQVMYNAEIKIIENGITKSVWVGNLAPTENQWNDIMFDFPYVRTSNSSISIEFCFNNCEWTSSFLARYRSDAPQFQANSDEGNTYSSTNTICNNTANSNINRRPDTRFGLSNSVAHQTLSVCGNDQVTLTAKSFSTIPQNFPLFNYYATYVSPQNIESRYYRIQPGRQRSWLEADHHCQSIGGNLAHIQNLAENNVVDNANGTNWIGGFQDCNNSAYANPSGGWEWSNGNNIIYTNWANNEPNNQAGEQAIEMYNDGTWNDNDIKFSNRRYILEIEDKYVWSNGQVTNSPSINVNVPATSTFWVDRIQAGGIRREYFTVIVNQEPSLNITSSSFTVCAGDSIQISAFSPSATSYNWNFGQSNQISGMILNQSIQVLDTIVVFVTVADNNNCQTSDSIIINTYQFENLNVQVVDSICDSSYAFFSPSLNNIANNYVWSNGITDSIIYNLSPGIYSVNYTDQNGCFANDSVNVGESGFISVFADSSQTICYGGQPSNLTSQSLNSLSYSNIQWNPPNLFINSNISNPQFINGFSLFSDTIFTVTYNNGVCFSTDTVRIDVNQRPIVSNIIVNPLPACENDTITIFAITSSPNIMEFWFQKRTQSNNLWTNINVSGNGWGISNPIIYGPINETTEFRVKIREERDCSSSDWGGPTNQGFIVPINNMNNPLIYHN